MKFKFILLMINNFEAKYNKGLFLISGLNYYQFLHLRGRHLLLNSLIYKNIVNTSLFYIAKKETLKCKEKKLQKKMSYQFLNEIHDKNIKFVIPIFKNYIFEHNCLYKYKTNKNGVQRGYMSYYLSDIFSLSCLSLLRDKDITQLYQILYNSLQLNNA